MNRRELVTGMLAGTAVASLSSSLLGPAFAASPSAPLLLSVVKRTIEVSGKAASVFGLQGPDGPGLRFRAGDAFNVLLRNETDEATIAHWHGLTPPWANDGVGHAPMPLIAARTDRSFDFPVGGPGTHWMHAHTLQEQLLLAAPLIVADPADDGLDEQEVVILLHDFSFKSPEELLAGLTGNGAGGAMDHGAMGHGSIDMSAGAVGMPMDLNDIEYDAYLANDRTLDDPEVVQVERGGRVRLRIINGATATAFTIDLGELEGRLIAVDGQPVEPIAGQQFPMSMGQRVDIRLQLPADTRSFPVLALREGAPQRTGVILQPTGSDVVKVSSAGTVDGPVLDLALESRLRPLAPLAARPADKTFEMTLNGDMAKYTWSLGLDAPILADIGDRVEVKLTNMSMMAHPMHLHGHHFQVVAIDGQRFTGAVRDTVLIPPMRSVTLAADADNVGQWAFHCHHLYHMATGMMSTFGYRT
ncbi:MAG: multicopper oxidase family protein [Devosia sp.]|uniref:multicopper oxidase family protein n=1 Tax=Devosia sp. 66-22 TaxID=1895753 RepID=UPI00092CBEA8|nr:multicopper oxidase family protein [Devosia sp. 66-22]MBN9345826.1 multicopper oxidase family protein [Devosia sp.]OJX48704.1 MAG: copper oxidase [Devosia sp. 66-22]